MKFFTADICDELKDKVQVLPDRFVNFGGADKFMGKIRTLKLNRNNTALIDMLKNPGEDCVAVVDVDAEYFAVVGENLMNLAQHHGWSGLVINGYIRDTHITSTIPVGLCALGRCPRKSFEHNDAQSDIELEFYGVKFKPGDWVLADRDGVIVIDDESMINIQDKLF